MVGTPAYIAPERLLGTQADHRADIYSLAVVLYEALAGRLPFGEPGHQVPGQGGWTERKAEHVVDAVRHRLARCGYDGVTADSAPPEAIKNNLLRFLTETATLVPPDLRLLETGVTADGGEAR